MRKLLVAFIMAVATSAPVMAECFDPIGCTDEDRFTRSELRRLSCDDLWIVRNTIYYEAGYCFKTDAALDYFGDDQCEYDDAEDLSFSTFEQRNINTIVAVEKQKGCR